MRVLVLIVLLGALPSFAEDVPPEQRYVRDAMALCEERFSLDLRDSCFSVGIDLAGQLAALERGHFISFEYEIDGDRPERLRSRSIAKSCREKTMDGKLVDATSAMACVFTEIQAVNRETRREKRMREEAK